MKNFFLLKRASRALIPFLVLGSAFVAPSMASATAATFGSPTSSSTATTITLNMPITTGTGAFSNIEFCYSTGTAVTYSGATACATGTSHYEQAPSVTTVPSSTTATVTTTITGLASNAAYYWGFCGEDGSTYVCYTETGPYLTVYTLPTAPTVTTASATSVGTTTATLNASVNPGSGYLTSAYVCVSTSSSVTWTGSTCPVGSASQSFTPGTPTGWSLNTTQSVTASATGMTTSTTYYYNVVATNSGGTVWGTQQSFTTTSLASQTITISAQTQTATTGSQDQLSFNAPGSGTLSFHVDNGTNGSTSTAGASCGLVMGMDLTASAAGTCYVYATIGADSTYASATSADIAVTFAPAVSLTPLSFTTTTPTQNVADTLTESTLGSLNVGFFTAPYVLGQMPGSPNTWTAISGCSSVAATGSGSSWTSTCSWAPSAVGDVWVIVENLSNQNAMTRHIVVASPAVAQTIATPAQPSSTDFTQSQSVATTATSGLAVTYSVSGGTASGCAVSSAGAVTATSAGTCVIALNQAGNGSYLSAPAGSFTVTFTAVAAAVTTPALAPVTPATPPTSNGASFAWQPSASATNYQIVVTNPTGTVVDKSTGTTPTVTATNLAPGTTYTATMYVYQNNGVVQVVTNTATTAPLVSSNNVAATVAPSITSVSGTVTAGQASYVTVNGTNVSTKAKVSISGAGISWQPLATTSGQVVIKIVASASAAKGTHTLTIVQDGVTVKKTITIK